jgi:hypothetical protein
VAFPASDQHTREATMKRRAADIAGVIAVLVFFGFWLVLWGLSIAEIIFGFDLRPSGPVAMVAGVPFFAATIYWVSDGPL